MLHGRRIDFQVQDNHFSPNSHTFAPDSVPPAAGRVCPPEDRPPEDRPPRVARPPPEDHQPREAHPPSGRLSAIRIPSATREIVRHPNTARRPRNRPPHQKTAPHPKTAHRRESVCRRKSIRSSGKQRHGPDGLCGSRVFPTGRNWVHGKQRCPTGIFCGVPSFPTSTTRPRQKGKATAKGKKYPQRP